ncbi:unnamed protein product [Didymodactylos carnosus]|uniref:Uncharacterized protein n=1 Tax=Didymodactylos carnosus TaxID=1234261 RepID=A0A814KYD1_9BILA|nr:unnamed protein product [Didymodactylos carnosus]CAF1282635.1 unnamed protein product [Didymodactylos carnosus]CAF3826320.1 unnamed protein product [Didymodactylos carnosus]CAF4087420.1 unnamed protein product [Didymodactylos carnosus]
MKHLTEHFKIINDRLPICVNQLNELLVELNQISSSTVVKKTYDHLDKWRQQSHQTIDDIYEQKRNEIDQILSRNYDKYKNDQLNNIDKTKSYTENLINKQNATHYQMEEFNKTLEITQSTFNKFKQNFVLINTIPLNINANVVDLQLLSKIADIYSLKTPEKILKLNDKWFSSFASHNDYLLLYQNSKFCLYNNMLTIVNEIEWNNDLIVDMCWSSTLDKYVILTEKFLFTLDETSMTLIERLKTDKTFLSCTCSHEKLFVISQNCPSTIEEYELQSFILIREWKSQQIFAIHELIYSIRCDNDHFCLLIKNKLTGKVHIELRTTATMNTVWSVIVPIPFSNSISRLCLLSFNEWLIIDEQSNHLIQISSDGKLKSKVHFNFKPCNAVRFDYNSTIVIVDNAGQLYLY